MKIISLHSTLVSSLFLHRVPFFGARSRQIRGNASCLNDALPSVASGWPRPNNPLWEDYLQRTSAQGPNVIWAKHKTRPSPTPEDTNMVYSPQCETGRLENRFKDLLFLSSELDLKWGRAEWRQCPSRWTMDGCSTVTADMHTAAGACIVDVGTCDAV